MLGKVMEKLGNLIVTGEWSPCFHRTLITTVYDIEASVFLLVNCATLAEALRSLSVIAACQAVLLLGRYSVMLIVVL